jgi:serine protease Do
VRLSDRREFIADVVGSDKQTDVALLKIDAVNLPVVTIGSGADLKVGEWVLAIGSPFGFDHSVTAGIVSAKGRNLPSENYVPFIQTDVAINPGNSGGPLFNLQGEVVGVNSQIYSRTGGFMGLSFSIPIEMAMNVADQLRATGRVQRGWLGVLIQDVTLELAESFGMSKPQGALVARVIAGGPAEKAGVQVGDIIVRFNDREVEQSSKLPPMVGSSNINEPARLVVLRDGKERRLTVTIGQLPDEDEQQLARIEPVDDSSTNQPAIFGLVVSELTPAQRRAFNLSSGGVIIDDVLDGPAKNAGILPGEVIVMIRNHRVLGVADFQDQLNKLPQNVPAALLVQDSSGSRWITLRLTN